MLVKPFEVPNLKWLQINPALCLVADDKVNEPIRITEIGKFFYTIGEFEAEQPMTVILSCTVLSCDEIICVCHNHKIYFLKEKKEKKRKLLRKAAWQKTKRKRNKCRRLARQRIIGEAQQMPCHYAVVFWFFSNQALVEAAYLAAFFLGFF